MKKSIKLLTDLEEKYGCSFDNANVKLIYKMPEARPNGFFAEIFPPMDTNDIQLVRSMFKYHFPPELEQLYLFSNGLNLFDRYIQIGGMNLYLRTGNGRAPVSLRTLEKPIVPGWPHGILIFACRRALNNTTHAYYYVDCRNDDPIKPVFEVMDGSDKIIGQWDSIDDWLSNQIEYYLKEYSNGRFITADIAGIITRISFFEKEQKKI